MTTYDETPHQHREPRAHAPESAPSSPRPATPEPAGFDSADRRPRGRLHMGTATSDPTYLPLTPQEQARERALERERIQQERAQHPQAAGGRYKGLQHSGRYLETPKHGHAIFTSKYERKRKRHKTAVAVVVLLALIAVAVWFFFLRKG